MVGDRHPEAVSALRPAAALCCAALFVGACGSGPRAATSPGADARDARAREVGARADVHPAFASFGVIEVAVVRPGGVAPAPFAGAVREALSGALLERGYSPLAPDYVDAAGAGVTRDGRTCVLQCAVTAFTRGADGAARVGAWSALVAPREGGATDTLYLGEVSDLPLPRRDEDAARLLADALLRQLPAR